MAAARAKKTTLAAKAKRASPRVVSGRGAYFKGTAGMRTATGYGDYDLGSGSSLGAHVGAWLGDKAQQLIKSVTGFGDYVKPAWNPKQNSLLSMGQDPPIVKNSPEGNFIVRHREYLQDIITGTPGQFVVTSYKIQPGLQDTFPWLSVIAQNFEQYKLRGMIFEFKSTSADSLNSTNTALGEVIMATEYDSKKPDFASKVDMQNHQYAVAARQSSSMLHPIECAHPLSTLDTLYIRSGTVPEDADSRMYDFGNFQIATVGQQGSNVNIGELWVTYEVELLKARLPGEGNIVFSSAFVQTAQKCGDQDYFGVVDGLDTLLQQPNNNLPVRLGPNYIDFPDFVGNATFQISIKWTGGTVAVAPPNITPGTGSGIVSGDTAGPFGLQFAPDQGVSANFFMLTTTVYLGTPVPGAPRRLYIGNTNSGAIPDASACQVLITSLVTGMADSEFAGNNYIPPIFLAQKKVRRSPMEQKSEEQAIKAEIERLTQLYETKIQRETVAPLSTDAPQAYLNGNYTPSELVKIADQAKRQPVTPEKDDWESMTNSTAVSIQAIVEKARLKRLAAEQHKQ